MSTVTANQGIIPFLWYNGQAEAAMQLYTSVFPHSEIQSLKYWGENMPFPAHWVRGGIITINGLKVYLFDAGPDFKFNESVSFFVICKTQAEVDEYWAKLTANGGSESQCGWLKDPYGFSWQIVPAFLQEKLENGEPGRAAKMMQAVWKMKKLDVAALEAAYNQ
ncbi:MAG TPA: VOC family protein [Chitinophaga sp.]